MVRRLLLIYGVVEVAAIVALAATIGVGWTLLALLASFFLGVVVWVPMAGWQLSAQVMQLRSGLKEPRSALGDGAIVTLATVLVLVPGLVTTILGILLLAPPVRNLARPALAAMAWRGFDKRIPLITDMADDGRDDRDYIDGEVIDVRDVEPPVLPPAPVQTAPQHHAP